MWTLWRESKAQSLGNAPRLSRKHAIENYPNKPQRREGRSAAKPQPKPRNTRNTRKWGPNPFRFPRIPRIQRFLSFGKLLAGCDQTGLLQCRGRPFSATRSFHRKVTGLRASPSLCSLRSSRLGGVFVLAPTRQTLLREPEKDAGRASARKEWPPVVWGCKRTRSKRNSCGAGFPGIHRMGESARAAPWPQVPR